MKNHKILVLILLLVLLQSCTVYNKTPISIEEAKGKGKVKVVVSKDRIFQFDEVDSKNGVFYGVNGEKVTHIDEKQITGIYTINEQKLDSLQNFKNNIFVSTGLVEFALGRGAYSTLNINYERRINKYLSTRLSYGRSFKSHGLLSEDSFIDIRFLKGTIGLFDAPAKKTFYTTSFCFTTSNPTSNFDLSVGYALIKIDPYTDDYYYSYKSETLHSPALEVGYRYTKDSFIFRTGVGWPYGRYMSIGYAF